MTQIVIITHDRIYLFLISFSVQNPLSGVAPNTHQMGAVYMSFSWGHCWFFSDLVARVALVHCELCIIFQCGGFFFFLCRGPLCVLHAFLHKLSFLWTLFQWCQTAQFLLNSEEKQTVAARAVRLGEHLKIFIIYSVHEIQLHEFEFHVCVCVVLDLCVLCMNFVFLSVCLKAEGSSCGLELCSYGEITERWQQELPFQASLKWTGSWIVWFF